VDKDQDAWCIAEYLGSARTGTAKSAREMRDTASALRRRLKRPTTRFEKTHSDGKNGQKEIIQWPNEAAAERGCNRAQTSRRFIANPPTLTKNSLTLSLQVFKQKLRTSSN